MKKTLIVIGIIALLLLVVACKEEKPPAPIDEITEEESFEIAKSMVEMSSEYKDYNGRNLRYVETITARCPYCWLFTFRFTMDGMEDPQMITIAEFTVSMQEGEMQEIRKTFTPKPCETNQNCVEDPSIVGVQWLCEEKICKKKPFGNPASIKCEEDGGIIKNVDTPEGQRGMCVFMDEQDCTQCRINSVCNQWEYFRGECKVGDCIIVCKTIDEIEGWYDCNDELIWGEACE